MPSFPTAYFISFRCYGTWFHGDDRGSSDRRFFNVFGEPYIPPDPRLVKSEMHQSKQPPFELGPEQRTVVGKAIFEVCAFRGYGLIALNVRTNHVHVVAAAKKRSGKNDGSIQGLRDKADEGKGRAPGGNPSVVETREYAIFVDGEKRQGGGLVCVVWAGSGSFLNKETAA